MNTAHYSTEGAAEGIQALEDKAQGCPRRLTDINGEIRAESGWALHAAPVAKSADGLTHATPILHPSSLGPHGEELTEDEVALRYAEYYKQYAWDPTTEYYQSVAGGSTIWFLGDCQSDPSDLGGAIELILDTDPTCQVFLCLGDVTDQNTQAEWTELFTGLSGVADHTWAGPPILITARGNHDSPEIYGSVDYWTANMAVQENNEPPPYPSAHCFAVTAAGARLIVLDEVDSTWDHDLQLEWVETNIVQAVALGLWPIIVSHRPVYSMTNLSSNGSGNRQLSCVALAESYSVKLWVHGHVHRYSRTHPIIAAGLDADGVTYINVGETAAPQTNLPSDKETVIPGAPYIARNDTYDCTVIRAAQQTVEQDGPVVAKLAISAEQLVWTAYRIIADELVQFDTVTIAA